MFRYSATNGKMLYEDNTDYMRSPFFLAEDATATSQKSIRLAINGFGLTKNGSEYYFSMAGNLGLWKQSPVRYQHYGEIEYLANRGVGKDKDTEYARFTNFMPFGDHALMLDHKEINVWNLKTKRLVSKLEATAPIAWPAVTMDFHLNRVIALTRKPETAPVSMEIWNTQTGERLSVFPSLAEITTIANYEKDLVKNPRPQPEKLVKPPIPVIPQNVDFAFTPNWQKWYFTHNNSIRVFDFTTD